MGRPRIDAELSELVDRTEGGGGGGEYEQGGTRVGDAEGEDFGDGFEGGDVEGGGGHFVACASVSVS